MLLFTTKELLLAWNTSGDKSEPITAIPLLLPSNERYWGLAFCRRAKPGRVAWTRSLNSGPVGVIGTIVTVAPTDVLKLLVVLELEDTVKLLIPVELVEKIPCLTLVK